MAAMLAECVMIETQDIVRYYKRTPTPCRGSLIFNSILLRDNRDKGSQLELAGVVRHLAGRELDLAVDEREERVIDAGADVFACMPLGTALANQNFAAFNSHAIRALNAQILWL